MTPPDRRLAERFEVMPVTPLPRSREIVDRRDVVHEQRPGITLDGRAQVVLTVGGRLWVGDSGRSVRVLACVPDLPAEVEPHRCLQRQLGNADEPELDLGADARPGIEAKTGAMNVRRRRCAGGNVLCGFGLRRVAEV